MSTTDIEPVRAHAKDMTDEEREAWRQWAHETEARVVNAIAKGKAAYWEMAEALYEFEDDGGWKALGIDTLNDWLGQPEVGLARDAYYRAIDAWKSLVVERRIEAGRVRLLEPTKVDVVLPAIKRGDKITTEALDDAEALSRSDLRDQYRKAKPKNAKASGQPDTADTASTKNVVQVEGVTGDEAANLASNGDDPSGQVAGKGLFESTTENVTVTTEPPSDDVSPSEPPDIEGTAQDVDGEDSPEAPGGEARAPLTAADVELAHVELGQALASGQDMPRLDRQTIAVLIDYLNDVPIGGSDVKLIMDDEVKRLRGIIEQYDTAGAAVVKAFNALPERARTKHLPKPVREAIVNLAALFE